MYHRKIAEKCLAMIQARWEEHQQGRCHFRIEEFTGKGWTDVIEFYEEWLKEVIKPNRKPATYEGYRSYLINWIKPFFEQNPVRMHEIQLDTLTKLLNFIELTGKGKLNVMMALRACMDYAWRSKRIPEMPPFPKREDYNLVEPDFNWLREDLQMQVINAIPEEHRPIFLWLKYHYRREGEAIALQWRDFDEINLVFVVRRGISARKVVESTKTRAIHYVPCDSRFYPIIRKMKRLNRGSSTEFVFQNPRARSESKRYTHESLNNVWKAACKKVGVDIGLYQGTKHSSCTQFINEKGGTDSELQMLTDHARLDSIAKYRKIGVKRKRELMEKVRLVDPDYYKTTTNGRKS
jgi:integrase